MLSLYLGGWSLAQIIDGPLKASMQRLGELWQDDPDGILHEHRATDIAIHALSQIRSLLPIPPASAPIALGGAPSGDPYILPTLAATVVLISAGFRATNLGPETPIATLERGFSDLSPRIIWLSVTNPSSPDKLRGEIESLAVTIRGHNCALVIGGRSARTVSLGESSEIHIGQSMAELEAFTRGLALASGAGRGA